MLLKMEKNLIIFLFKNIKKKLIFIKIINFFKIFIINKSKLKKKFNP